MEKAKSWSLLNPAHFFLDWLLADQIDHFEIVNCAWTILPFICQVHLPFLLPSITQIALPPLPPPPPTFRVYPLLRVYP